MSKYHDDNTTASDPVNLRLNNSKLKEFKNQLSIFERFRRAVSILSEIIEEHICFGDSRAAVVISSAPKLIIAAYSDELDCVALLRFHNKYAHRYGLKRGDRLLTVNTYRRGPMVVSDLVEGEKSYGRYCSFYPVIAEFLSDDVGIIENRKREISEDEWSRTIYLGNQHYFSGYAKIREGNPFKSYKVAK